MSTHSQACPLHLAFAALAAKCNISRATCLKGQVGFLACSNHCHVVPNLVHFVHDTASDPR